MAGTALDPVLHLIAVGITDRSATPEVSARLFAEEPYAAAVLERVRAAGAGEALVLTTCERVEVIAAHEDPALADRSLLEAIAGGCGIDPGELAAAARGHVGEAALRHVFSVAASLESAMIGDPQILGQLKESHRRAADAGAAGPALDSALRAAYTAARRVRAETALAEGPVSIAASAQLVARDVHGDLRRPRALLIGLGEIGEFLGGELKAAGVRDMVVIHASPARAEAAARRLGCHFRTLADLDDALAAADIVISATGAGSFTVVARAAEAALIARRREPMFLIDAAVPGDIDPDVAALDGAFVYDIEDLERIAQRGRATREAAVAAAQAIVEDELAAFIRQRAERSAVPALVALRQHFEATRAGVLAERGLSAEEATRRLINRLLHDPSEVLRGAARRDEAGALATALRRLFRMPGAAPNEDERGEEDNR